MKRSTDSEKLNQASRGAIRLGVVLVLIVVLACAVSISLMYTIHQMKHIVDLSYGSDGTFSTLLEQLMLRQRALTAFLLVLILLTILSVTLLILQPIRKYIVQIRENSFLTMRGAYELRYLAEAYNLMTEENRKHNDALRYMVAHDALTGLLNRGAFDQLRRDLAHDSIALLLIDVDKFKEVNDGYGHDVGDQVLQRVAYVLGQSFRASDYPCRIGGDEFAVIMSAMNPGMRDVIVNKVTKLNEGLQAASESLPKVTLSIGVAFSRQCGPEDDIFRLADAALYRVKEQGRNGCAFFDPAVDSVHHPFETP